MRLSLILLLLSAVAAAQSPTQTFDTSGNGQLNGTFNFREVGYQVYDAMGDLNDNAAVYGTISFDGNGNYTINGVLLDYNNGSSSLSNQTGTYSVSASGLGFLSSPLAQNTYIYGLVSNGIFIGSSTESGFNDLFIAAPAGSPANATFAGNYSVASVDLPSLDPTVAFDAFLQMTADGQGNLGTVSVTGYAGGNATAITQSVTGASYSFSSGSGVLHFGGNPQNQLIAGDLIIYISPDGSFIFGGSANDFDLFVGVRTATGRTPSFAGLYYQAGLDEDESNLNNGAQLDTYYGAFNAGASVIWGHQRLASYQVGNAFDYTYSEPLTLNADGTYDDNFLAQHYVVGAGGAVRIGTGVATASGGPILGLSVALAAPTFGGQDVYLNPTGVLNAASSAPFTASLAPGELITLYGTGLASGTVVASSLPFPAQLGGVQVMINNRPAPIYYVSPTQISVLVPYATELTVADIQVINNGTPSNTVSEFVNQTMAGVFTIPVGGLGYAAALHKDYSLVSTDNPAQPGETIQVFLTGLGAVSPAVADGAAGPGPPNFSMVTGQVAARIQPVGASAVQANVTYAGLAPELGGLYQLNIEIPTGLPAGDAYLDIAGADSYTSEAGLPLGSGAAVAAPNTAPAHSRPHRVLPHPGRQPAAAHPWVDLRHPALRRVQ